MTQAKDITLKPRTHPIVASMPAHLKDHDNFKKIQRAILDAGATRHSHAEMLDWASCQACQQKQQDRLMMMKSLGFASKAHYLTWRKIHEEIDKVRRVRLEKYNSPKSE